MLQPIALSKTHMECYKLEESVPVLMDLLAFEKTGERPGEVTLKHPNTDWTLVVHEGGNGAGEKQMHNHWGVRVLTTQEVDAAYEYLNAHKEQYRLPQIGKPLNNHGSYSLYFLEPGSNGWEIECYADALRKEIWKTKYGGVWAPHWERTLPGERFPGRGYVPQGFTHGTLAIGDHKVSRDFYSNVLGLEVYQANPHVVYIKHPKTKCYVVCAERKEWKVFSDNFRFALTVESQDAVSEVHRWLSRSGKELGVIDLGPIREEDAASFFLLRDPDRNCWEITSPN
jgi:catechol 2,3-dioxygenase-like lactoylglutathione lyase family enzyme